VTDRYAIIQEPWLMKGAIGGLSSCGKVFKTDTTDKTGAFTITKCTDAVITAA
jgi:hypothetical protein